MKRTSLGIRLMTTKPISYFAQNTKMCITKVSRFSIAMVVVQTVSCSLTMVSALITISTTLSLSEYGLTSTGKRNAARMKKGKHKEFKGRQVLHLKKVALGTKKITEFLRLSD